MGPHGRTRNLAETPSRPIEEELAGADTASAAVTPEMLSDASAQRCVGGAYSRPARLS